MAFFIYRNKQLSPSWYSATCKSRHHLCAVLKYKHSNLNPQILGLGPSLTKTLLFPTTLWNSYLSIKQVKFLFLFLTIYFVTVMFSHPLRWMADKVSTAFFKNTNILIFTLGALYFIW